MRKPYGLLHQIEQCSYEVQKAHDMTEIAIEMGDAGLEEIKEKLAVMSLELSEMKSKLREMIGGAI